MAIKAGRFGLIRRKYVARRSARSRGVAAGAPRKNIDVSGLHRGAAVRGSVRRNNRPGRVSRRAGGWETCHYDSVCGKLELGMVEMMFLGWNGFVEGFPGRKLTSSGG